MHYREGHYYLFFSSGTRCGYDKSMSAPGDECRIVFCRSAWLTGDFRNAEGKGYLYSGGTTVFASHGYRVFGAGGP